MAGTLTFQVSRHRHARCVLSACVMLLACGAQAAGPAAPFTPYRPAAALTAAAPASAATPGEAASAPEPAAARLTGLRLAGPRSAERTQALIDGRWLTPGERVGAAALHAVDAQGAWLRHADGRLERLALLPAEVQLQRTGSSASAQPQRAAHPAVPPTTPTTRLARAAHP